MVAIVVDDRHTVHFGHFGEPAVDPGETGQGLADFLAFHAQMPRYGNRRQGVRDVVIPRHRQSAALDRSTLPFPLQRHVEMRHAVFEPQVHRAHIGLRVEAKRHDTAVGETADQRLHFGMIGATDRQTVKRHVRNEIVKAFAQRIKSAPVFHVFGVDVGDNRNCRGQAVERAIRLVRLDHHPLARPGPRVGPVSMDHPAIDHRGVKAALVQQRRHHRGGGGLAVGARHRNVGFQTHQLGQHFGAAHHRKPPLARLFQFRVALFDRRGNHHHRGLPDIFRPLALKERRPQRDQPFGDLAGLGVGPLYPVAKRHQHFGDARHADAADTDEMDRPEFHGQFGGIHRVRLSGLEIQQERQGLGLHLAWLATARPATFSTHDPVAPEWR